ncbi:MAG: membrane dipeptidase, partial [Anaerolineales bacterium]|nr:membrane dipeptidase [Anaerolineales bacterium]
SLFWLAPSRMTPVRFFRYFTVSHLSELNQAACFLPRIAFQGRQNSCSKRLDEIGYHCRRIDFKVAAMAGDGMAKAVMKNKKKSIVVDAHEDLAWNYSLFHRDCMLSAEETRRQESITSIPAWIGDSLVGYPDWIAGNIGIVFATLFLAPERRRVATWERLVYQNSEDAYLQYSHQLDYYHHLVEHYHDKLGLITTKPQLVAHLDACYAPNNTIRHVGLVILMEGADAIRSPSEMDEWHHRGVRIVGPVWGGTRYAGGTGEPGALTADGRALLERMAERELILDVSHMSDQGVFESVERYPHALIATHSNPRALLPHSPFPERHLADDAIRAIAGRDGIIGIALYNPFLKDGWMRSGRREEVTLDHAADCIDYICQLVGDARHAGIGSDFNGGFGLDCAPAGLDSVADLGLIGDRLLARGYSPEHVEAILGANWIDLLNRALPEG